MPVSRKALLVCPGCGLFQPLDRFADRHLVMGADREVSFGEGHSKGGIKWQKRSASPSELEVLEARLLEALKDVRAAKRSA